MKQAMDFLNKVGVYYLATTDDDAPCTPLIGFVMDFGSKITFCTKEE